MRHIGRYEIVGELGRGAMGVVYRARDPRLGRDLALKTIRLGDHADSNEVETLRQRLFREAQSAGRLSHPGIVTIFDVDQEDGLAYILMELVEGRTLAAASAEALAAGRKLEFAADLLAKVGAALDYAHEKGIIHRDIKPSNLVVTAQGVKILDFGVARIASSQLTRTGTVVGTPNYMSPEQVRGESVNGRSDQFSLAVIVYELLTGERPFQGDNITSTIYRVVAEDPAPLRRFDAAIPPAMEAVVLRALAKAPARRFDSCREFATAFAKAVPLAGSPPSPAPVRSPAAYELDETAVDLAPQPAVAPAAEPLADIVRVRLPEPTGRKRRGASEAEPAGGSSPAPQAEKPAAERRWPLAIFTLLVGAILAFTFLLVRSPGLLENPAQLIEIIFGLGSHGGSGAAVQETGLDPPAPRALDDGVDDLAAVEVLGAAAGSEVPAATSEADGAQGTAGAPPSEAVPAEPLPPPARPAPPTLPGTAAVLFTSPVDGVVVTVDNNLDWRCETPCEAMELPQGEHSVVAVRTGYRLQRRSIQVEGSSATVALALQPLQATLIVASDPSGGRVFLDGRDTGRVTTAQLRVTPGRHAIRIVKGDLRAERTIDVDPDALRHLEFRLGTR